MPGTTEGGRKAAETMKAKYGEGYFQKNGRKGGKAQVSKGFAKATPEQRSEWGMRGGKKSRRGK